MLPSDAGAEGRNTVSAVNLELSRSADLLLESCGLEILRNRQCMRMH